LLADVDDTSNSMRVGPETATGLAAPQPPFDTVPEIADRPGASVLPAADGHIAFEGVSFRYAQGPLVLTDITTSFDAGKTTALVGPSGAGKTTLVSIVARFYDPTEGRVTIDGHDLRDLTVRSVREQIAVVPQEPILFATTVADNIRYGRLDATDAQLHAAAQAANATEFIDRLPEKYDTIVGERGVKLSVGQRQRIAIARALLRDSPVLLLDEATSSLDNESEYLVQEALARLMLGRTTIVIAHRLTTVERADRILVLERGRIVEDGTHQSLMNANALYWRLYTRAFRDEKPADSPVDDLPIVIGMDPRGEAHGDKVGEGVRA
jgi:subfamily B ATP-binding cassette protein MsbA